mgnify:CR=1 FL=1
MSARSAAELAQVLGVTARAVQKRAADEAWPYEERPAAHGRGRCRFYALATLPWDVRRAVQASDLRTSAEFLPQAGLDEARAKALLSRFQAAPEWSRRRAEARLAVLQAAERYFAAARGSRTRAEARFCSLFSSDPERLGLDSADLAEVPRLSAGTLRRWRGAYRAEGLAGLLSDHGAAKRGKRVSLAPEAEVFLAGQLAAKPHLSAATLHKEARSRFNGQTSSYATVYRFLRDWKAANPHLFQMLDDPRRWKSRSLAAFGDRAADVPHAGHTWEMDSTPADLMTADGRRAAIIGCIDVYTRRLCLVVAPVSRSEAIAACMRKAFLAWGVPARIRKDNGKDYRARHILAIEGALSIEHLPTRPYHGEDKPFIERALGTYTHGLHELLPGYTGHSVAERAALRERRTWAAKIFEPGDPVEIPLTLAELQERTDAWVRFYESSAHSGLNGRTPLSVWEECRRKPRRIRDERLLDILLAPVAEPRTVGKKGIRHQGLVYTAPELVEHVGKVVDLRLDPEDAGRVYVFHQERFLCTASDDGVAGVRRADYLTARKAHERNLKQQARALQDLSRSEPDPFTLLTATVEIAPKSSNVTSLQPEHDTPGLREARRALAQPAPARGLAQELAPAPVRDEGPELPPNVVQGGFRRAEAEAPARPVFTGPTAAVDAYDWLCGLEAEQGALSAEDREWKEFLESYPEVRAILDLRAANALERNF